MHSSGSKEGQRPEVRAGEGCDKRGNHCLPDWHEDGEQQQVKMKKEAEARPGGILRDNIQDLINIRGEIYC